MTRASRSTSRRPGSAETDAETPSRFMRRASTSPCALPAHKRERGFANLNCRLDVMGRAADNWRFAIVPLPGYPIRRIHAGQFIDEGAVWSAQININEN